MNARIVAIVPKEIGLEPNLVLSSCHLGNIINNEAQGCSYGWNNNVSKPLSSRCVNHMLCDPQQHCPASGLAAEYCVAT